MLKNNIFIGEKLFRVKNEVGIKIIKRVII